MAAASAHRRRQPVDVRHDLARHRHLALVAGLHEIVLHVDDDEGGLRRVDHSNGCARPARFHALDEIGGDRQLVHGCSLLRNDAGRSNGQVPRRNPGFSTHRRCKTLDADRLLDAHARFVASRGRPRRRRRCPRARRLGKRLGFSEPAAWHPGCMADRRQITMKRRSHDQEASGLLLWTAVCGSGRAVARGRRRQGQAQDGRGRALAILCADVRRAVAKALSKTRVWRSSCHRQWRRPRRRADPLRWRPTIALAGPEVPIYIYNGELPGQAGDLLRAHRDRRLVLGVAAEDRQVRLVDAQRQEDLGLAAAAARPSSISNTC